MKIIQHFLKNSLRNFNYIVYSEQTMEGIFFDPAEISQTIPLAQEKGVIPKYLLLTHHHFDHIKDADDFMALAGTEKLMLKDGEIFSLSATEKIQCLYTPGHVHDHYCYLLIENEKPIGLISGDTVFNAGVGNCKNGGNVEELFETIEQKILPLSNTIKIYPSHDYFLNNLKFAKTVDSSNQEIDDYIERREKMNLDSEFLITTLEEEKKFNPFFRAFTKELQQKYAKSAKELFIDFRLQRDHW